MQLLLYFYIGSQLVFGKVLGERALRGRFWEVNVWNSILHKSSIVSIFRGNVKASGSAVSWKELRKAIPANLKGTVQGEQQSINQGNEEH